MKIYVVTEGDYSDYHIVAVCTSKQSAECIQRLVEYSEIEEYESDVFDIKPTYKLYRVKVADGMTYCCEDESYYDIGKVYVYKTKDHGVFDYFVSVFASDEEHAKKIAYDKIAQRKAEIEGLV